MSSHPHPIPVLPPATAPLVDSDWVYAHTNEVTIVCATMGNPPEVGIPGSIVVDFDDDWSDQSSGLPHTVPGNIAELFEQLGATDPIVAYDTDSMSAARLWWLARVVGRTCLVLDGGLRAWRGPLGRLQRRAVAPRAGSFPPRHLSAAEVFAALEQRPITHVLDARSAERFAGVVPEIRPGLRVGHMPGAKNLPYTEVYDDEGRFLPPWQLRALFDTRGLKDPHAPLVFTCGSAISACVLALAAHLSGYTDLSIYEGSWSEWAKTTAPWPVTTSTGGGDPR